MTGNRAPPLGSRLRQIREHSRLSQHEMAAILGVSLGTYGRYERGVREPQVSDLLPLAARNINLDWLLTGRGDMLGHGMSALPGPSPTPRSAINADLLGRVIDGVLATYKNAGQQLAPVNQGTIVAPIYDRLIGIDDEAEQRGALKYALSSLAEDLRTGAVDPRSTKRRA